MTFSNFDLNLIRNNSNWHFERCDPRFGHKYPGRIPGQIYINLFYYFTQEKDYILDVFCGSGTGLDVGKFMKRNVYGLDINPSRENIKKIDVLLDKNPFKKNFFQLIFLDPPYFNINKGKYTNSQTDLSNLNLKNFLSAIDIITRKFINSLKHYGYFALIISNKREKGEIFYDLGFMCERIVSKYLKLIHRISVPYENTKYHSNEWRVRCLKYKIILIGTRDLLIYKKV